ncbi:MAG TPA: DUF5979 domain-containing protein, partial [Dermatophilaceae bacterium]|nr:DUF5979 domain-containing protein [Dermatophilaceae bacterium]
MMVAGVVALALALNGTAATGVALIDEPLPAPSLSEQVQQDDVTTSVEVTDEASPESSGSAADEAGDEPTDLASDSASPSEEASSSGAPSELATAEDIDGSTESPSATATEDASETRGEGSSDPEVVADEADAPAEPAVGPEARSAIAPFAAGDATITVRKGDRRLGNAVNQAASGLAGAVFEAYAKGNVQTQSIPGGQPVATCTTDATGTCDLLVDSELGPRYVVVEQSAPAGWRTIEQIALGAFNASGTSRAYRWNVGVTGGGTTIVPQTAILNQATQTWPDRRTSPSTPPYQWANAKDNVPLPPGKCGLNIAMLFDQSGSIGSNLPLVKSAAKQFIDDLTGTPTSIALFTFSTNSPQNPGGSQNRPDLVSIADPTGAAQVKGYIDGFSGADGGTNWDAGLRRVANASQQYDVLIVLTDGNPTAWEGEKSSTGDVNDYDVENAVHSANWVKSEGTRIVAVGFSGQSGGLNSLNLTTISGTVQDDDYYLTTFGDLDEVLASIALNGCGGTISVQKRIAPSWPASDTVPQEPDWPFSVNPAQDYVTPLSGTTGPAGEPLTFKLAFEQNELARDVTISEPANFKDTVLVQDAGKNARCFNKGQPLPADRLVNAGAFGFTVKGVVDKDIISCVVVDSDAQLQAVKYNDTNGNGRRDTGEPGLSGWTMFLDTNGNSALDTGERSVSTNTQGQALFDRLEAPKEYRVCEVLQSGWFNTDPGGGAVCKTQQVNLGDAPAGPVLFGNVQAGGFRITKEVVDDGGFVADDLEFTINVACTPAQQLGTTYPRTFTLTGGESATVGPLINGTTCTVTETRANGAVVTGVPRTVSIPTDNGVTVTVTNTYPVGYGEVVKVVDGPLAGELAPPGTEFEVAVSCTFPAGHPSGPGPVPGYNPKVLTIESAGPGGTPDPVSFGPLPVGTTCTSTETDDNGADPSNIAPSSVTIREGGPTQQTRFTATNTYNPAAVKVLKKV